MSVSRYKNRDLIFNEKNNYDNIIKERAKNDIFHFDTPTFNFDTSVSEYPFSFNKEIWKNGDRLHKYSFKYYGEINFWWVIGLVNQKPTDNHFKAGDLILIPTPLSEVLEFIGFEI